MLIVDDEVEIRHALRLLFETEGFTVVGEASDGNTAIDLATQLEPSFIVLDYSMPRMNGQEAADEIRKVVPTSRIVAFSALLESKPAWADAFLNKDRISEIAPLVERLLLAAS
ncbi:MAG TPA: response regulator transcription factor [Actinomycetota bacterium]